MATTITSLGHSAFRIVTGGRTILIDPFLTGNPLAKVAAEELSADYIIVSHGHGDHIGDTVSIARRCNALVIANYEIAIWLEGKGVERTHGMNTGGSFAFDFGSVKLTMAHHGSMLPDGSYGGLATGVLLKTADGNVYFAGDTALFSDMTLIGDEGLKVAILPIGDNFTMGPEDSVKALKFLRPETVIPCHYNTFSAIEQDVNRWAADVAATPVKPLVLAPGQSMTL